MADPFTFLPFRFACVFHEYTLENFRSMFYKQFHLHFNQP